MLKDIKVGDLLAVPNKNQGWGNIPKIYYDFCRVERITKTQAVCGKIRFRLSDGAEVGGGSYFYRAVMATQGMVEDHKAQVQARKRYLSARKRIEQLEDHAVVEIRKLRTEQIEALADAWEKILAM